MVSGRRIALPTNHDLEAAAEARQEASAGRRQLNSEGQPIESHADSGYRLGVILSQRETWPCRSRTLYEEGDSRIRAQLGKRWKMSQVRQAKRRHPECLLPAQVE